MNVKSSRRQDAAYCVGVRNGLARHRAQAPEQTCCSISGASQGDYGSMFMRTVKAAIIDVFAMNAVFGVLRNFTRSWGHKRISCYLGRWRSPESRRSELRAYYEIGGRSGGLCEEQQCIESGSSTSIAAGMGRFMSLRLLVERLI